MTQKRTLLILTCGALLALGTYVALPSGEAALPSGGITTADGSATSPTAMGDSGTVRDAVATRPAPAAGPYGAPVGSRFRFAFVSERGFTMVANDQPGQPVRFDGHGELVMTVAARRGDELIVALRCERLELSGQAAAGEGRDLRPLADEIAGAPFLLRMREDGRHLGLRFADSHGLEGRQWLRNLLSGLQFVVSEPDALAWEVDQEDLGGTTRARCSWERRPDGAVAGRLNKELVAVVRVSGAEDMGLRPELEGAYTARLGGALAWLGGCEGSERCVTALPDSDITVHTQRSARFELIDSAFVAVPEAPDWGGAWATLDGAADGAALAAANADAQARERLKDLTVRGLALVVLQAAEAGQAGLDELTDARMNLTRLLEQRPEELGEVRNLVLQAAPESRGASELLAAIGAVDDPAAEGLLRDLLVDDSQPEVLRLHTTVAMFQLRNASPATIEVSRKLAAEGTGQGDLRRTGMLLLGRFGDGSGLAFGELAKLEAVANRDGLVTTWLEAIGNARSPAAVPVVAPYLEAPDVAVRVAAVHALEGVRTAAATELLAGRLATESEYRVREALVSALGSRPEAVAIAAMDALLRNEPELSLRLAALERLAEVPGPEVTRLFQRTAVEDPEQRARDYAAGVLANR